MKFIWYCFDFYNYALGLKLLGAAGTWEDFPIFPTEVEHACLEIELAGAAVDEQEELEPVFLDDESGMYRKIKMLAQ